MASRTLPSIAVEGTPFRPVDSSSTPLVDMGMGMGMGMAMGMGMEMTMEMEMEMEMGMGWGWSHNQPSEMLREMIDLLLQMSS